MAAAWKAAQEGAASQNGMQRDMPREWDMFFAYAQDMRQVLESLRAEAPIIKVSGPCTAPLPVLRNWNVEHWRVRKDIHAVFVSNI